MNFLHPPSSSGQTSLCAHTERSIFRFDQGCRSPAHMTACFRRVTSTASIFSNHRHAKFLIFSSSPLIKSASMSNTNDCAIRNKGCSWLGPIHDFNEFYSSEKRDRRQTNNSWPRVLMFITIYARAAMMVMMPDNGAARQRARQANK